MIQIIEAGTYQIGNQLETSCVKIDLAKGVYFLSLTNDNGTVNKKVVIK